MANGAKTELDKLRAEKERRRKYTYDYNAKNYYRAVCLWPVARRAELDAAIQASGVGSVSGYLCGLIDDDLRRRGLVDGGAGASGAAAGPADDGAARTDNRAEDSGGEVQPMESAGASRVEDGSTGSSSAYMRHLEAGHTMRKVDGVWVWSDGERVALDDEDDSHKLEQAVAIRRADMHASPATPKPSPPVG